MDIKSEFLRIMAEQTEIALATSVNNVPNVRIVNFYFEPVENILYFSSFKGNDKVKEINVNLPPFLTEEMSMSKRRG